MRCFLLSALSERRGARIDCNNVMLWRCRNRLQSNSISLDNFSALRQKLFRNIYTSTPNNCSDGSHVVPGTCEPHFRQTQLTSSNQSPSQDFSCETPATGTWPDAVADIPSLASQSIGQRVPQIYNGDDYAITDQPICRMRHEPGWDTFSARA